MRLQFWKKEPEPTALIASIPVVNKFNVVPRTDVGEQGLPADPDMAAKLTALRKRRESLLAELQNAKSATESDNRWTREVRLIDQAIGEIEGDRSVGIESPAAGIELDKTPIEDVVVVLDPVATVSFRIGDARFRYQEDLDWAERGYQIARSDLHLESGDPMALVPDVAPADQHARLAEHLSLSLFEFASDMRDRALADESFGHVALRDLAVPDRENGGWLDWLGQSPIGSERERTIAGLNAEIERLRTERDQLLEDQAKAVEQLPFVQRRLADVQRQIAAIADPPG